MGRKRRTGHGCCGRRDGCANGAACASREYVPAGFWISDGSALRPRIQTLKLFEDRGRLAKVLDLKKRRVKARFELKNGDLKSVALKIGEHKDEKRTQGITNNPSYNIIRRNK